MRYIGAMQFRSVREPLRKDTTMTQPRKVLTSHLLPVDLPERKTHPREHGRHDDERAMLPVCPHDRTQGGEFSR